MCVLAGGSHTCAHDSACHLSPMHGSAWSGVVTRGLGNVSLFSVGMVKVSSLECEGIYRHCQS